MGGRRSRGDSPQKYHQKKRKALRRKEKKTKGDTVLQQGVKGKVKRFFGDHGFIIRDDGCGEVFLHISALLESGRNSVEAGKDVTFDVVERSGRLCATNILFRN